jgi:hypothetical protein
MDHITLSNRRIIRLTDANGPQIDNGAAAAPLTVRAEDFNTVLASKLVHATRDQQRFVDTD